MHGYYGWGCGYPKMPKMYHPKQFLKMLEPAIEHGIEECEDQDCEHGVTEAALMACLMCMGYPYKKAYEIVECWEDEYDLF